MKKSAGARSARRASTSAAATIAFTLLLLSAACDPPGKPKREVASQDVSNFQTLFSDNCAGCHGSQGRNGPARILNDALYLSTIPRETLKQILIYGRPAVGMPAWARSEGGPLTPQQIDVLVSGIEANWAKPVDFHGLQQPAYAVGDKTGDANSGRKLFSRSCFMCHGPGAQVGPVTDPAYLSLVSNQMLRTSIIVGRPDLGMPDYRTLKLGKPLNGDEITDIVAFLASKRPPDSAAARFGSAAFGNGNGQGAGLDKNYQNESSSGAGGATGRGNEGSGNGPGSPRQERGEGNKSTGSSSQRGIK